MNSAGTFLALAGVYAGLGVAAALVIVIFGFGRVDRSTIGSTWGFKLFVFSGIAALWPLVLVRWFRGAGEPPEERNAHRCLERASGDGPL